MVLAVGSMGMVVSHFLVEYVCPRSPNSILSLCGMLQIGPSLSFFAVALFSSKEGNMMDPCFE